jgi:hypothetical protein
MAQALGSSEIRRIQLHGSDCEALCEQKPFRYVARSKASTHNFARKRFGLRLDNDWVTDKSRRVGQGPYGLLGHAIL